LSIDVAPVEQLKRLAAAEGATLYMVLLAGFLALLRQRSGKRDLVVGTDVAGRDHPQAQRLVGLFVNQLVLRVDGGGDPSFRALLGRVRGTALTSYAHQRLPFDKLVEALRPPRDPRHNPLFQVMFVLESAPLPQLALPGLAVEVIELDDGGSPFDLSVLLAERDGRLGGVFRYDTALYDRATIDALAEDYAALLAAAAARPETPLSVLERLLSERVQQRKQAEAVALRAARIERFRGLPRR
jgi:non-ribosomal peptide synthetase component F